MALDRGDLQIIEAFLALPLVMTGIALVVAFGSAVMDPSRWEWALHMAAGTMEWTTVLCLLGIVWCERRYKALKAAGA